jgi:hypothetical protein
MEWIRVLQLFANIDEDEDTVSKRFADELRQLAGGTVRAGSFADAGLIRDHRSG